ncbi:MAG TPA: hypothetical protein VFX59_15355 [Polyangiales bacterium]|nr:hypothetical protein [Polyangiales bacterium]
MPQSINVIRTLSLLTVIIAAACGAESGDPDSYEDDLPPATDPNFIQSAVNCDLRPRACGATRAPNEAAGSDAIRARLGSINPRIRTEYFDRAIDATPLVTADGRGAFQFFEGNSGTGAIYSNPDGLVWDAESAAWVTGRVTEPIYGAGLLYWLDHGYELALGYPSSPEYAERDDPSSMREQRFGEARVHTSPTGAMAETVTLRTGWNGVWGKGYLGLALNGSAPDSTFELTTRNEPAWDAPCAVYDAPYAWSTGGAPCQP